MSDGSMAEDLEAVFPRQAVIVKNGKIFVEDEPFFCNTNGSNNDDFDDEDDDDDKSDDSHHHQDKPPEDPKPEENCCGEQASPQHSNNPQDGDDHAQYDGNSVPELYDDLESEKENRYITSDLIAELGQRLEEEEEDEEEEEEEEEEEDGSDDGDEDYEEEERFVRFLGREELFQEVAGLHLQRRGEQACVSMAGLGGVPGDFDEGLFPEGVPPPGVSLPPEEIIDDPEQYLDYFR
ncbi:hypothetical protein ACOMHN_024446 [Nucella lapillus]